MADAYSDAVLRAERETELFRDLFLQTYPYEFDQVLAKSLWLTIEHKSTIALLLASLDPYQS